MSKKKTNNEFVKEVYDLVGDSFIFLEEYKGSGVKIRCTHGICGYEFMIRPCDFLRGRRCTSCETDRTRKTNEEFIKEVYDLVNDEYIFKEEYKKSSVKIKCKHNICEKEWEVQPNSFLMGSRCPYCSISAKKTDDEFIKEVYELVGDKYVFLEKYKGGDKTILCSHTECKFEWEVSPRNFFTGRRCPHCSKRKTNKQFLKEVHSLVENEYTFLEKYQGTRIKIKCIHNICKNEYLVNPHSFLRGNKCPKCKESKGEKRVSDFLKRYDIDFTPQFRFDGCRNRYPLPFDFYLNELNICIEYDGQQHFNPIIFFGGKETFRIRQINDNIKTTYCKENNIPLLRIPYWDYDNIESILEKELVKYGILQKQITMMEMD